MQEKDTFCVKNLVISFIFCIFAHFFFVCMRVCASCAKGEAFLHESINYRFEL